MIGWIILALFAGGLVGMITASLMGLASMNSRLEEQKQIENSRLWIPMTERIKPDHPGIYIVTIENQVMGNPLVFKNPYQDIGKRYLWVSYFDGDQFEDIPFEPIIAWLHSPLNPLPDPYEDDKE